MQPPSSPKRRAFRSASSSALLSHVVTRAHVRRPSRIPASISPPELISHPRDTSLPIFPLPPTPKSPQLQHPLSIPRLVQNVDALLACLTWRKTSRRKQSKHYRRVDRDVAYALATVFLLLFVILFAILKFFFGATAPHIDHPQPNSLSDNIFRIHNNLQPNQFWPAPDSLARSLAPLPKPLRSDVSIADIHACRVRPPPRSWFSSQQTAIAVPQHPRVTIVAACRDRTAFLQTALSGWIAALPPNADLLLVDWGTTAPDHVPLAEVVRVQADPRVSVVTVSEPGPWVLSRAYNLAFSLARGEWILKLDCDTVLHKSFFELNPAPTTEDIYFRFFWENAKDDNEQHLNGVFMAKAAALARIHGYDERITTYGWDDSDLYKRLEAAYTASPTTTTTTLKPRQFDPKSLFHMTHGDDLRGANQKLVMGPTLETQVNSQALASLSSWTAVGDTQKTKYRLDILSRDAQFLLASTLQTPPPLLQQLSAQEKLDIVDEATNRVLHDIYGFPWSVLSEINRSRAELVRSLAALGRSTHWQSGNGFIFAEVGGTVPERILAMASAIALAMTYERPLFMAWNSGPRQDPRPRVTDFFDVEPPGVLDDPFKRGSEAKKLAHVFQIGRWKCRSVVDICAESDPAFKMMAEYRSGGHDDQTAAAQTILEVLKGSVPGKRNVMLRLEGPFPLQTVDERAKAFASLSPSQALAAEIARIGKKTDRLGLYLGRGVRSKGIEAMTKRLDDHNGKHTKYFISGAARDIVELARTSLRSTDASTEAADLAGSYGSSREIREVLRDIAELYALSSCEHMVNDGRPPSIALEVISLLRQKNV